jgi:prefoldin subunit 1
MDEISGLNDDVNLYKGVGKMYVLFNSKRNSPQCEDRFMMMPRKEMEQELKAQEKELTDDINNLNKKVRITFSSRSVLIYLSIHPDKISRKTVQ